MAGSQPTLPFAIRISYQPLMLSSSLPVATVLISGLVLVGFVFAINSSLHSYLIVSYANDDGVSLDVGFYYMANAMGRLIGTVLSGWIYQSAGMVGCLWVSAMFITLTALISTGLPRQHNSRVY